MPSVHPDPLYSRAEIGILGCSKCRRPMRLACIEPSSPGFDVRTFECSACDNRECYSVSIQGQAALLVAPGVLLENSRM
jgi:hypothetical protein